jgi:hypothetical protein
MVTYSRGGSKRELIVTPAYLPYDSDEPPPSEGLRKVVDYCSRNKMQLITSDSRVSIVNKSYALAIFNLRYFF